MWKPEHRLAAERGGLRYPSDLVLLQGRGRLGGAWLGSPVLGHWWPGLQYHDVYYIPAILGSLALIVVAVDVGTMMKK
jgi:hypothetical protein